MQCLRRVAGEVLVPCQVCLKRSRVDQRLLMNDQTKLWGEQKAVGVPRPSQPDLPALPPCFPAGDPSSSFCFTPTCSSCFSLGSSHSSLPKSSISPPNISLPVVLFFSKLSLTVTRFLTLHSVSTAETCFIISPPFFSFGIRKRLQYTEQSLRGMHEARHLMKAGTIGSWSFLSKRMNLGRASIWELNYFTPTWNLYNCKAKTECLLHHIWLIFSRSARILIPHLKRNYKSVYVDIINLICIFLWKFLIWFLSILSNSKL